MKWVGEVFGALRSRPPSETLSDWLHDAQAEAVFSVRTFSSDLVTAVESAVTEWSSSNSTTAFDNVVDTIAAFRRVVLMPWRRLDANSLPGSTSRDNKLTAAEEPETLLYWLWPAVFDFFGAPPLEGFPAFHMPACRFPSAQHHIHGKEHNCLNVLPFRRSVCGKQLADLQLAFHCSTCALDSTAIFCSACFDPSRHEGHDVKLVRALGICDCGVRSAIKPEGFCAAHPGHNPSVNPVEAMPGDLLALVAAFISSVVWAIGKISLALEESFENSEGETPSMPSCGFAAVVLLRSLLTAPESVREKLPPFLQHHEPEVFTECVRAAIMGGEEKIDEAMSVYAASDAALALDLPWLPSTGLLTLSGLADSALRMVAAAFLMPPRDLRDFATGTRTATAATFAAMPEASADLSSRVFDLCDCVDRTTLAPVEALMAFASSRRRVGVVKLRPKPERLEQKFAKHFMPSGQYNTHGLCEATVSVILDCIQDPLFLQKFSANQYLYFLPGLVLGVNRGLFGRNFDWASLSHRLAAAEGLRDINQQFSAAVKASGDQHQTEEFALSARSSFPLVVRQSLEAAEASFPSFESRSPRAGYGERDPFAWLQVGPQIYSEPDVLEGCSLPALISAVTSIPYATFAYIAVRTAMNAVAELDEAGVREEGNECVLSLLDRFRLYDGLRQKSVSTASFVWRMTSHRHQALADAVGFECSTPTIECLEPQPMKSFLDDDEPPAVKALPFVPNATVCEYPPTNHLHTAIASSFGTHVSQYIPLLHRLVFNREYRMSYLSFTLSLVACEGSCPVARVPSRAEHIGVDVNGAYHSLYSEIMNSMGEALPMVIAIANDDVPAIAFETASFQAIPIPRHEANADTIDAIQNALLVPANVFLSWYESSGLVPDRSAPQWQLATCATGFAACSGLLAHITSILAQLPMSFGVGEAIEGIPRPLLLSEVLPPVRCQPDREPCQGTPMALPCPSDCSLSEALIECLLVRHAFTAQASCDAWVRNGATMSMVARTMAPYSLSTRARLLSGGNSAGSLHVFSRKQYSELASLQLLASEMDANDFVRSATHLFGLEALLMDGDGNVADFSSHQSGHVLFCLLRLLIIMGSDLALISRDVDGTDELYDVVLTAQLRQEVVNGLAAYKEVAFSDGLEASCPSVFATPWSGPGGAAVTRRFESVLQEVTESRVPSALDESRLYKLAPAAWAEVEPFSYHVATSDTELVLQHFTDLAPDCTEKCPDGWKRLPTAPAGTVCFIREKLLEIVSAPLAVTLAITGLVRGVKGDEEIRRGFDSKVMTAALRVLSISALRVIGRDALPMPDDEELACVLLVAGEEEHLEAATVPVGSFSMADMDSGTPLNVEGICAISLMELILTIIYGEAIDDSWVDSSASGPAKALAAGVARALVLASPGPCARKLYADATEAASLRVSQARRAALMAKAKAKQDAVRARFAERTRRFADAMCGGPADEQRATPLLVGAEPHARSESLGRCVFCHEEHSMGEEFGLLSYCTATSTGETASVLDRVNEYAPESASAAASVLSRLSRVIAQLSSAGSDQRSSMEFPDYGSCTAPVLIRPVNVHFTEEDTAEGFASSTLYTLSGLGPQGSPPKMGAPVMRLIDSSGRHEPYCTFNMCYLPESVLNGSGGRTVPEAIVKVMRHLIAIGKVMNVIVTFPQGAQPFSPKIFVGPDALPRLVNQLPSFERELREAILTPKVIEAGAPQLALNQQPIGTGPVTLLQSLRGVESAVLQPTIRLTHFSDLNGKCILRALAAAAGIALDADLSVVHTVVTEESAEILKQTVSRLIGDFVAGFDPDEVDEGVSEEDAARGGFEHTERLLSLLRELTLAVALGDGPPQLPRVLSCGHRAHLRCFEGEVNRWNRLRLEEETGACAAGVACPVCSKVAQSLLPFPGSVAEDGSLNKDVPLPLQLRGALPLVGLPLSQAVVAKHLADNDDVVTAMERLVGPDAPELLADAISEAWSVLCALTGTLSASAKVVAFEGKSEEGMTSSARYLNQVHCGAVVSGLCACLVHRSHANRALSLVALSLLAPLVDELATSWRRSEELDTLRLVVSVAAEAAQAVQHALGARLKDPPHSLTSHFMAPLWADSLVTACTDALGAEHGPIPTISVALLAPILVKNSSALFDIDIAAYLPQKSVDDAWSSLGAAIDARRALRSEVTSLFEVVASTLAVQNAVISPCGECEGYASVFDARDKAIVAAAVDDPAEYLPDEVTQSLHRAHTTPCPSCHRSRSSERYICLCCGTSVCAACTSVEEEMIVTARSPCRNIVPLCPQDDANITRAVRGRKPRTSSALLAHTASCGGYGGCLYYSVLNGSIFAMSPLGIVGGGALHTDAFGETDIGVERGRRLVLDVGRFRELRQHVIGSSLVYLDSREAGGFPGTPWWVRDVTVLGLAELLADGSKHPIAAPANWEASVAAFLGREAPTPMPAHPLPPHIARAAAIYPSMTSTSVMPDVQRLMLALGALSMPSAAEEEPEQRSESDSAGLDLIHGSVSEEQVDVDEFEGVQGDDESESDYESEYSSF